jgi:gliding motility-associated-like protein
METLNMLIFDRWGAKVYEWNTTQTAWDGRDYDGRNLPEGVYYYVLYSTGSDAIKTSYVRKGSITLLR